MNCSVSQQSLGKTQESQDSLSREERTLKARKGLGAKINPSQAGKWSQGKDKAKGGTVMSLVVILVAGRSVLP